MLDIQFKIDTKKPVENSYFDSMMKSTNNHLYNTKNISVKNDNLNKVLTKKYDFRDIKKHNTYIEN
jgi:hypothetical protein